LAFQMEFISTISVLLLVMSSQGTNIEGGSVSSALSYWHKMLPTTPIPNTLLEKVSTEETEGFLSLKDIHDDRASVSIGKSPRKIGGHIHETSHNHSASSIRHHAHRDSTSAPVDFVLYSKSKDHSHRDSTSVPIFLEYSSGSEGQRQMRDALLTIYFLEKTLRTETRVTMEMALMRSRPESRVHFLPRSVANEIPFSSDKLSVSLQKLNIAPDSEMAFAMAETLTFCEDSAMTGETKYCATSLESLIDHTTSKLGTND
ncbi:hypothetical protein KI387_025177, partial [Taxus chinensis]